MFSANKQSGFTLMEVLLALVIISLAMMAGLSSTQSTTRNLHYVQDRTLAYWVAQNALVQMQLKMDGLRPTAGRWHSQMQLAEREWYWRAFSNPTADPNILQILVEVSEQENGPPLTTLVNYWPIDLVNG
jgi:general secretion pathway protein I